jgi:hypothetical protein
MNTQRGKELRGAQFWASCPWARFWPSTAPGIKVLPRDGEGLTLNYQMHEQLKVVHDG